MITKIYTVGDHKSVQVLGNDKGINFAYCLTPDKDISDQPEEVRAVCNEAWTPEIKEAYNTHLLESVI